MAIDSAIRRRIYEEIKNKHIVYEDRLVWMVVEGLGPEVDKSIERLRESFRVLYTLEEARQGNDWVKVLVVVDSKQLDE